jgi:DNA-binding transcriptional LysR family regulator
MQLDLNLLRALDALVGEGSVSAAAARLHLSPPAMSRTLGRIRQLTGDEILVRTGRTMTPTSYALSVHERAHALVVDAEDVLAPNHEIDLASLTRTFTLQCHDAIITAIGPSLMNLVAGRAPEVALRLLPEPAVDTPGLRHGHVDLEIGSAIHPLPEISHTTLAADRLLLAARKQNPLIEERLTLHQFAKAEHIIVSRRGRLRDPIDDLLAQHGMVRRVRASAPTSGAAMFFVSRTDLVTLVPQRMCQPTVEMLGLVAVEVPFTLPDSPIVMSWHRRYDNDPSHQWLRQVAADAVLDIVNGPLA